MGKQTFAFLGLTLLIGFSTASMDKALSSAVNRFSAAFTKEVDQTTSSVCSPLSAELVLALVSLGARGVTQNEIFNAINLPDDKAVRSGFVDISNSLKTVKGVTFKIANKVYVKEGTYNLNSNFKNDAVKVFNAEVEKVNFDNGPTAAKTINDWVENHTNEKIKDLIDPNSLGPDTRLVLVNALYFKGTWKNKFPVEATRDRPFHVTQSKQINVPFMHLRKRFSYGVSTELDAQLLELPYVDNEASLLIVLPNKVDGLSEVVEKLASGVVSLEDAAKNMYSTEVDVSLPKFRIETKIDLKQVLVKLGVSAIFDQNRSNLSGILDPAQSMYVSEAVQKAFIEVNEEGAEAAAASGMVMMLRSMPQPAPKFVADKPFYFSLLVRGTTLFTGIFKPNH